MTKFIRTLSISTSFALLVACAAGPSPGVGAWDVIIDTPVGSQAGVWTINADGTGTMGSDLGDQAIEGIALEGNTIAFDVDIDAGGQSHAGGESRKTPGRSLAVSYRGLWHRR